MPAREEKLEEAKATFKFVRWFTVFQLVLFVVQVSHLAYTSDWLAAGVLMAFSISLTAAMLRLTPRGLFRLHLNFEADEKGVRTGSSVNGRRPILFRTRWKDINEVRESEEGVVQELLLGGEILFPVDAFATHEQREEFLRLARERYRPREVLIGGTDARW
ncbi:MAG TPA: hypothetical protein VEX38_03110 [Fimbriimonadaceae bacterium]|nr:hypothetical protein [Fimbriimonadaceae bacterium]